MDCVDEISLSGRLSIYQWFSYELTNTLTKSVLKYLIGFELDRNVIQRLLRVQRSMIDDDLELRWGLRVSTITASVNQANTS